MSTCKYEPLIDLSQEGLRMRCGFCGFSEIMDPWPDRNDVQRLSDLHAGTEIEQQQTEAA